MIDLKVKAILCDVDGTLVDSNGYHVEAWQEAFRDFGVNPSQQAVREQIGKGADQLIPCFLSPEQISSFGEKIEKKKDQLFKQKYLGKVKGFPGVQPLFQRLFQDEKRVILATSGGAEEIDYYIRLLGIGSWVGGIVTSDDVARSKPYPDIFHIALDRFQLKENEAVILGDTPYDVMAGKKIGLQTIAVLTGGFNESSLREAGAVEIYKDLPALLLAYQNSYSGINRQ
jgi:HAD superfamily hydrolase (TIGR01549 family)